jgi:hypothetical protein
VKLPEVVQPKQMNDHIDRQQHETRYMQRRNLKKTRDQKGCKHEKTDDQKWWQRRQS